jgi:hypothetical protein
MTRIAQLTVELRRQGAGAVDVFRRFARRLLGDEVSTAGASSRGGSRAASGAGELEGARPRGRDVARA